MLCYKKMRSVTETINCSPYHSFKNLWCAILSHATEDHKEGDIVIKLLGSEPNLKKGVTKEDIVLKNWNQIE